MRNSTPDSVTGQLTATTGGNVDGRMDLLSVVLHEFGHALGLEHGESDADGFMASTLDTGIRYVVSGDTALAPGSNASGGPLNTYPWLWRSARWPDREEAEAAIQVEYPGWFTALQSVGLKSLRDFL
jgi:hypothetical protein